jgi:hypothetical protein
MKNKRPSIIATLTALLFAAFVLAPLPAQAASDADTLTSLVNQERTSRGLNKLVVNSDLVAGARSQAQAIADAGELFHNPDLGGVTTGWKMLGENLGMAPSIAVVHEALMDSPGHRANILNSSYDQVGVGVVRADGYVWVAEVFMQSYNPPSTSFDGRFRDDDGSVHEANIEALAAAGITTGCGNEIFCPEDIVTREQMAAFLQRALDLPAVSGDHFVDDNSSQFEGAIESLVNAGITSGCGTNRFCPRSPVTRGQMAAFLQRALNLPLASGNHFTDDNGSSFERSIEALAAAGITKGCSADRFCPNEPVTRAQMATFLARALGL